ncbi:hypothetical protein [Reyranella sp.]|uniref:hypothetical protein n=1 Tax=Reyranella sp. TaxID=1929291 RepID=UPI003BA844C2
MVRFLTGPALVLAALVPAIGVAADVKIVGQSHATPQLKRDVLTVILGYARGRHSCGTLTSAETAPLAKDYEPKSAMFRTSAPGHVYERWVVDLCGTKRAFLVALWPSPKGGADYKVVEVPPGGES